jgi:tRNA pseudouridine55 synthase
MARRKKGRDISGWLVVDKPAGMSSSAVVNKVKWAFQAKKAGHAGTLDPLATGVLAVALGEATKTMPYITDALKAYEFVVRLGQATDTDDTEGEIVKSSEQRPTDDEIVAALPGFTGDIMQRPPSFSAVKVDGERAYKLARAGEELELAERELYVDSLEMAERTDADHVTLEMVCGKGGYVRSIARDLGDVLGCHGHVQTLRRVWSGPFDVEDAMTFAEIDELARLPELDDRVLPLEIALQDLPELAIAVDAATRLRNGNPGMVLASSAEYGDTAWASLQGKAVAIGVYRSGELHPKRVINIPDGDAQ